MNKIKYYIKKYNSIPVPTRASLWYTICNLLQKGISFIVIPIYTRILTPTEYGQYTVFQSWRDILIIFATLNLYCGVFTKAMVEYDKDRDRYTACMQGLSTVLTVIMFLIYALAHNFWNRVFEMNTVTMLFMFLYFLTYPAFSFWSVRQRVEYKYIIMVVVTLLVSVATPVVSILLLVLTPLRVESVILGFLAVQSCVGLFFYIWQFAKGRTFYNAIYWKRALFFNIPLIPHYLSLIILGQADRIMIKEFCGEDKAGIYNLAYQVSMVMSVFMAAVNNSLVPWTYEKMKQKNYKDIRDVTRNLCVLMAVITVGITLIAPEAITILGTKEYREAVWVIPAVAVGVYFTFCYGLFSTIEFYFSATKFVMIASVVGAVLNIILNWLFIPRVGFIAAGYTTMVCYFVFMIMHYCFMKRICKREINDERIYNVRFMWISCAVLIIAAIICMILYKEWIIRYILVIAIGIIIFLNRKKVIDMLGLNKNRGDSLC